MPSGERRLTATCTAWSGSGLLTGQSLPAARVVAPARSRSPNGLRRTGRAEEVRHRTGRARFPGALPRARRPRGARGTRRRRGRPHRERPPRHPSPPGTSPGRPPPRRTALPGARRHRQPADAVGRPRTADGRTHPALPRARTRRPAGGAGRRPGFPGRARIGRRPGLRPRRRPGLPAPARIRFPGRRGGRTRTWPRVSRTGRTRTRLPRSRVDRASTRLPLRRGPARSGAHGDRTRSAG